MDDDLGGSPISGNLQDLPEKNGGQTGRKLGNTVFFQEIWSWVFVGKTRIKHDETNWDEVG